MKPSTVKTLERKGKLITVQTPSKVQHKTPCTDCPFRRDAVPDWLGGNTAAGILRSAHGEDKMMCHVKLGPQCAGFAIFRANICKSPRDKSLLELEPNKIRVFANDAEFIAHHRTWGVK